MSRLNVTAGSPNYSPRWDLNADGVLNVADMAEISIPHPRMFNGQRAYGGPPCVP